MVDLISFPTRGAGAGSPGISVPDPRELEMIMPLCPMYN
jgi:hypothetical protein